MGPNAGRLALLMSAILVLVIAVVYSIREPGAQWSSFMMGVAFAALIFLAIWGSEEDW